MAIPVNSIIRAQRAEQRITAIVTPTNIRALRVNDLTWSKNGERPDMPFWATVNDLLTAFPADVTWSISFAYPKNFFEPSRKAFKEGMSWDETYGVAHRDFRGICEKIAEFYGLIRQDDSYFNYTYVKSAPPAPAPAPAPQPIAFDPIHHENLVMRVNASRDNHHMAYHKHDMAIDAMADAKTNYEKAIKDMNAAAKELQDYTASFATSMTYAASTQKDKKIKRA